MLGFIIGTIGLVGLVKAIRHGHYHNHGPFGCGRFGSHVGHAPGWRGFGGRQFFLRSIFERLETTPGQEKVVVAALRELEQNRATIRDEVQRTRAEMARVIASGLVDDSSLEEAFASHDRVLARLRVSLIEALKQITEALDERQRGQLARMLEGGGWLVRGRGWGGPYRGVWA